MSEKPRKVTRAQLKRNASAAIVEAAASRAMAETIADKFGESLQIPTHILLGACLGVVCAAWVATRRGNN